MADDDMHWMDCGIAGGWPHPASAHEEEEGNTVTIRRQQTHYELRRAYIDYDENNKVVGGGREELKIEVCPDCHCLVDETKIENHKRWHIANRMFLS
jgi:hypothetical protein